MEEISFCPDSTPTCTPAPPPPLLLLVGHPGQQAGVLALYKGDGEDLAVLAKDVASLLVQERPASLPEQKLNIFTDSALWAESVIESPCPYVCMYVC